MTLLMKCPVCAQEVVLNSAAASGQARCPSCRAELRLQPPPLTDDQILEILSAENHGSQRL